MKLSKKVSTTEPYALLGSEESPLPLILLGYFGMGMYADPADCVLKQRLWLLSKGLEGMCEKGPERL